MPKYKRKEFGIELEKKIEDRVQEQMDENQKEYYLREQIKVIQEELGDDGDSEILTYKKKIAEAKLPEERPIIAGVFENRLKSGMPLQIDASVLYAATEGKFDNADSGFIAERIANLDSPYNTYKYPGLPAGPICNPGLASIQASLKPSEHNYYYYHTDNSKDDGSHVFSQSYGGHLSTMN